MLKTALLSLARHYDSLKSGTPRRTHNWGDEGYRPELAGRFGST